MSCLRSGPLSLSMNNAGGFFRTDPTISRPNMQLYFQAFSTVIPKSGERPILTPDPWPGFSIGLSNCRPSSRGEIMIRSANPRDYPKIAANAFSTEADVAEMLAAVKFVRKIAAHAGDGRDHRGRGIAGPVNHLRRGSDRRISGSARAPSITRSRPAAWDRTLPLPSSTRACGFMGSQGLRVIDASIFPDNITGNTNAAAIMTGWKGAELVLEDQK